MTRSLRRSCLPLALLVACAIFAPSASAGVPAQASKSCDPGNTRGYGTTYVIRISVSGGPTCRGAKALIKSFHACRPGRSGRCRRRVEGYRCSENRFNSSRQSYDSKVTCRKGGRTVKHTYTQFT
jgi:hypothetical protein